MDQPGEVANPAGGHLNRENEQFLLCPRSRLRIRSRETRSAILSRISLLILQTQSESGAYSRHSSRFTWRRSVCILLLIGLGVSTPTSSWPPSFLGRDHQFSCPHDGSGECGFYVVHNAVFRRVCPEAPSNRCGHLLSKLGITHQAPTATGGLAETLNRRFRAK